MPVAPASPSSAPSSVSTAAFVSELGNLTLVSGDGSVTSVDVDAGIPILGDATIPNPRWLFDDRLVEYVADDAGTVQVVRVDIQTGRVTTQPYWAVLIADGDVSTSPDDEGRLIGRIPLMAAGDATTVTAVGEKPTIEWQFHSPRVGDRTIWFDPDHVRFLAPAPEGLLAVTDGVIGIVDPFGEFVDLDVGGVVADDISSAAYAPGPHPVFGLDDGRIVVFRGDDTVMLTIDDGDPVTVVAWDAAGTSVVAETSAGDGTQTLYRCDVVAALCNRLDVRDLGAGRLVRGTPIPPDADSFPGIWPEDTLAAAESAANASDAEAWRSDPDLLAARYADTVLGWENPVVSRSLNQGLPYHIPFDVERRPGGPAVAVGVAQVAGETGWVVTTVSAPLGSFSSGYSAPNKITFGFDRLGRRPSMWWSVFRVWITPTPPNTKTNSASRSMAHSSILPTT